METEKRSNLYLLTGLIFGLAIGLVISLMITPAINRDAAPAQLAESGRAEYRLIIAKTFTSDYNLVRAQSRLLLLGDPSPSAADADGCPQHCQSGACPEPQPNAANALSA
jgi:hypothetical protein